MAMARVPDGGGGTPAPVVTGAGLAAPISPAAMFAEAAAALAAGTAQVVQPARPARRQPATGARRQRRRQAGPAPAGGSRGDHDDLAAHAAVGLLLVITAIYLLTRAIIARHVTLVVTSVVGLAAIIIAATYGAGFASKVTDADSLGMAMATAVALASYAIGLFVATARGGGPS